MAISGNVGEWLTLPLVALCVTLHASLQHEVIHGHPTRSVWLNRLLVTPAIGLFVPFDRFHDLHSHHHRADALTDPIDDPESFYLSRAQWNRCAWPIRVLLRWNNTLLGRLTVGPAIALTRFYRQDVALMLGGDWRVARAWLVHLAALVPVIVWVGPVCGVNPIVYAVAVAYPAYGLLMLRTFAEHQAHADPRLRTAIVEDRGPLAWLFLFNNLHIVHHRRPDLPWYVLPRAYWRNRAMWRAANGGYVLPGYIGVFTRYLVRAKEPVVHPYLTAVDG